MEVLKTTAMTIREILRKKGRGTISVHHTLQRQPGQWSSADRAGYISDILQGLTIDPLKIGEENLYGAKILWVLDGVQRLTIAEAFINNEFSVSSSVERYMIEYFVSILDEDGLPTFDEDGKPILERREFDIRRKKFKQLPAELQEEFMEYKFTVVFHPDCTSETIAYHLKRYNAGKPMNAVQKGFTYIGDRWGNAVRNISALSFFTDGIGNYTPNDSKVGNIDRAVAESIMTTRHLNAYRKNFKDNTKYLEQNATADDFEYFRGLVERLAENIDSTVGQMFDKKDSFLWFGLYGKFDKIGLTDEQFNTIMLKLNKGMYTKDEDGKIIKDAPMTGICVKEIDGTTFEQLWKNSSTKDANLVKTRIDFLTKLACDCFGVEMPVEEVENDIVDEDVSELRETTEAVATPAHTPSIFTEETTEEYDEVEIHNDELEDFATDFVDNNVAIESLILTTKGHGITDFTQESLSAMIEWYEDNGNQKMLDDCLGYKSYLEDADIDNKDPNVPFYVWAAKYAFERMDEDIDIDVDIAEWLNEMYQTAFKEIDSADNYKFEEARTIEEKKQEVISCFDKYIKEGM